MELCRVHELDFHFHQLLAGWHDLTYCNSKKVSGRVKKKDINIKWFDMKSK